MRRITAAECRTISKPGFYRADDTLYLYVKPSGRRTWVQRVLIDGRRHNIGLGSFPVVSLAKARHEAFENRVKIQDGRNPLDDKRQSKAPTFRIAAVEMHAGLVPTFRNHIHARNWIQAIQRHAFPKIGNIPVDRITQQDVLRVLTPIWTDKSETARKLRQRIRKVLGHCQAHGFVDQNVADDRINAALPTMPKVKAHHRALVYREAPDAWQMIESGVKSLPSRLCLQFIILTGARSGQAREAVWSEVDLDARTWTIPADRMKTPTEHRVPLSDSALAVLEAAAPMRNPSDLIFPSPVKPHKPMTPDSLMRVLRALGIADKTDVHGFRATFRTWASECTDIPREVLEMALAHNVGDLTERAYSRSDLLEKRVTLMRLWDDFLHGE